MISRSSYGLFFLYIYLCLSAGGTAGLLSAAPVLFRRTAAQGAEPVSHRRFPVFLWLFQCELSAADGRIHPGELRAGPGHAGQPGQALEKAVLPLRGAVQHPADRIFQILRFLR